MKKRAFTLVEALISIAFLGIGISACLGALGKMTETEAKTQDTEQIHQLANQKLQEIIATREFIQAPLEGDFTAEGDETKTWSLVTEESGVENLLILRFTLESSVRSSDRLELTHVVYNPPATTQGTAGGAN